MDTLLYKYNMISVTRLKKNIRLVYLSARGVYPLSMFTLRCNFTTCSFSNFVKFWVQLFLRINLSSYFQASYFSGILQISGIANLQHGIFLNFSDIFLMFLEESGVIFLFWNKKSAMVANLYLWISLKDSGKILRDFCFSLIWRNSEGM